MWRAAAVLVLLLLAPSAGAQERALEPSSTEVLLSTQAVLHLADMISTAAALQYPGAAREANPLLAPFGSKPVVLAAVSGGIDLLQVVAILKIRQTHPRLALAWSLALVATEVWTVTNNVQALGTLEAQARDRRP